MNEILAAIKILDVYTVLTGCSLRRASNNRYRGKATWRNGDGLNVSLDNERGVWHDFATGDGGGILDLIVRIQGGSRQDALRWAADFTGIPLEAKEFTPEDQAAWLEARQALERDLPEARRWQRAAINMAEDALVGLKAVLLDPAMDDPQDIHVIEAMVSRLRPLAGERLVEDYRWWCEHYPGMTAAMIRAVRERETKEMRTLRRYLRHESTH